MAVVFPLTCFCYPSLRSSFPAVSTYPICSNLEQSHIIFLMPVSCDDVGDGDYGVKVVGTESFLVLGPGLEAVLNPLPP